MAYLIFKIPNSKVAQVEMFLEENQINGEIVQVGKIVTNQVDAVSKYIENLGIEVLRV